MSSEINESTTIRIFPVVMAIPAIIGLVSWISFIAYTTNSNASQIQEIRIDRKDASKDIRLQLSIISDRLSRIETKLETSRR